MKRFVFLLAAAFFLSMGLPAVYGFDKDINTNGPSPAVWKEVQIAQAQDTSMKQEYEKYQKKAHQELKDYKMKMKELEAKAKNLEEKAKVEVNEGIKEFHREWNVADQKLKSMKSASAEAWEKMKTDVDSAIGMVKEDYDKVAAKFKG